MYDNIDNGIKFFVRKACHGSWRNIGTDWKKACHNSWKNIGTDWKKHVINQGKN